MNAMERDDWVRAITFPEVRMTTAVLKRPAPTASRVTGCWVREGPAQREAYRADALVIRQLQRRAAIRDATKRVANEIESGVVVGVVGWITFEWIKALVAFVKWAWS